MGFKVSEIARVTRAPNRKEIESRMFLAVDLGFGYVKAVSDKGRALFPSVIAPAGESNVFDMGGDLPGHVIEVRLQGTTKRNRLYVGELAARDGRAAQLTFGRDRFARDASLVLTLAAAHLVGADGPVTLGFGVPLAYYSKLKEEVAHSLQGAGAYVSVNGSPEHLINLHEVHVFPQGVGAFYSPNLRLPGDGTLGLIDVGFYTTDYLLVEISPQGVQPYTEHMSSVEVGVSTALKVFADRFRQETGKPLTLVEAERLWKRGEITFAGRRLSVKEWADEARTQAARSIVEAVRAAWSERIDFVDGVILAGGGALEFEPVLRRDLPGVSVAPDPQFANAQGFLAILKRVCSGSEAAAARV